MQICRFEQPPQPTEEQVTPLIAGGQHSVAYAIIPPRAATRKHYHPIAEETYYILSGMGRLVIDGQMCHVRSGDTVLIEPNERHQIWAEGDENLVFVVVCAPPWESSNSVFVE